MEKSGACLCGAVRIKARNASDATSISRCEHDRRGAGSNLPIGDVVGHKPGSFADGAVVHNFDLGVAP
ncbi:MAG: hypothetical protein ABJP79_16000 [Tateyamaria sp.]|uniref:hypothetical protein n=1 Tax=Tateyamaria sp. TaxID=1929288 RepID=UPI0032A00D58